MDPQVTARIRAYLSERGIAGWLVYDFRGLNPVFAELMGRTGGTRRAFLAFRAEGEPVLVVHQVDARGFAGLERWVYRNRAELVDALSGLFPGGRRVLMEYSPGGALPTMSYVDAGTFEFLTSLGFEILPSADLYQELFARWTEADLAEHRLAASELGRIVLRAFEFIGENLGRVTEGDVAGFIRAGFEAAGLESDSGPNVSVNAHSADPHYEPMGPGATVSAGDWVLIDLWARRPGGVYADITWVGYAGREVPARYREAFDLVRAARDLALKFLQEAWEAGRRVEGWEVDRVARNLVAERGFGASFTHRLGHSLGREVHGKGANLDDYETHDTRALIPGLGFTIEPGLYFDDFGVRSEINVYLGPHGPEVTTPVQEEIVLIGR